MTVHADNGWGNHGDNLYPNLSKALWDKEVQLGVRHKETPSFEDKFFEDKLPSPKHWREVVQIGESIMLKHKDLFESLNLDESEAMAHLIAAIFERENVQTGGKVAMQGDSREWFENTMQRLPRSWVEKGNQHGSVFVRSLKGRGYHIYINNELKEWLPKLHNHKDYRPFKKFFAQIKAGDSILLINNHGNTRLGMMDVSIHEYLHFIQRAIPELDAYFIQLWKDRTEGEKTRPLAKIQRERNESPSYGKDEVGRRDSFVDVYYGKNYGNDYDPKPLEVLTMTLESMLGTGGENAIRIKELFEKDRELFHLALGLLIRFKP